MKFEAVRTGIILKTEKYQECLSFYSSVLGLNVVSEKVEDDFIMSELAFGDSYFLVETGGKYSPTAKDVGKNPITIRFDVADTSQVLALLSSHGVKADYYEYDWGKIVLVYDPDGNRVEFKAEP